MNVLPTVPPKRIKNIPLLVAMAEAGMSNAALADKAGVHPITVSFLRNMRSIPKPDTAGRISKALGKSPAYFGWGRRKSI